VPNNLQCHITAFLVRFACNKDDVDRIKLVSKVVESVMVEVMRTRVAVVVTFLRQEWQWQPAYSMSAAVVQTGSDSSCDMCLY
jgi:hypothetical protein